MAAHVLAVGDSGGFKVGDLPNTGGQPLIDTRIAEVAVDGAFVTRSLDRGTGGDNRDGPYYLDLDVAEFELLHYDGAISNSVQLHGLVIDLARPVDADKVVGEQFVHDCSVAGDSRLPPLLFHILNLFLNQLVVLKLVVLPLRMQPVATSQKRQEEK